MNHMNRVWLISESYFPDEVGTAFYMTELAETLAVEFKVRVLCGYPIYDGHNSGVRRTENRNGVRIKRCVGTKFNKHVFILRIVNLFTISIAIYFNALIGLRKKDIVIVVTNPPLLPFIIKFACFLRGAKCVLKIDDVYPEVLMATGHLSSKNVAGRLLIGMNKLLYRTVDQIVVLGRDMNELAEKKLCPKWGKIKIIPNWADLNLIHPEPKGENSLSLDLGLMNKFVVLCAGNMGRAQAIENMIKAAELLGSESSIHFLFIGSGAKRQWIADEIIRKSLQNVTLFRQKPRSEQAIFLNACDIVLISLLPGMTGAGVPSRLYNAMAAGKPIISFASATSEISRVVCEEDIGWVVNPEMAEDLAKTILEARLVPEILTEMGKRARIVAMQKYSQDIVISEYISLIRDISSFRN